MSKGPDAFRTISEVAEELDLPQHVLRFWETRFTQIKPMKRGGGRRYYRPDDVDLLRGIRRLLYGEGYTIKGVQRILKEQGARHVIGAGQGHGLDPAPQDSDPDDYNDDLVADADYPAPGGPGAYNRMPSDGDMAGRREPTFALHRDEGGDADPLYDRGGVDYHSRVHPDDRVHPPAGPSRIPVAPPELPPSVEDYLPAAESRRAADWQAETAARYAGGVPDPDEDFGELDAALARAIPPVAEPVAPAIPAGPILSVSDVEGLRATLMELLECKRILDNVR
jgi:DNA-binding transcriptional MerR regulator